MSDPIVADIKPIATSVEAGEEYHWCSCGRSANRPFCDGSHKATGPMPGDRWCSISRCLSPI